MGGQKYNYFCPNQHNQRKFKYFIDRNRYQRNQHDSWTTINTKMALTLTSTFFCQFEISWNSVVNSSQDGKFASGSAGN